MLPVLVIRPWLSGLSLSGLAIAGRIVLFTVILNLFYHMVLLPMFSQEGIYIMVNLTWKQQSYHPQALVSKRGCNDLMVYHVCLNLCALGFCLNGGDI